MNKALVYSGARRDTVVVVAYKGTVRPLKIVLAVVIAVVVGAGVLTFKTYWWNTWQTAREQSQYDEFYAVPDPVTGDPGEVIRSEAAPEWDVEGGKATRIMYVTETEKGEKRVSSGMVWVPEKAANGERKIVAWAHGTLGLGNSCVPSRSAGRVGTSVEGWLTQMVGNGWVVTATDYTGLGTPPQAQTYLLGQQESRDVINSVRAARNLPGINAGKRWGVYGHSQGGHSALWTANTAKEYAPELELVGTAAAAPAADLFATFDQQWDKLVAWVIGPDVVVSWPLVYPDLDLSVVSADESTIEAQSQDCDKTAGIFGLTRMKLLGENFFSSNPLDNPSWARAMNAQTPKPPAADMPIFISDGTADEIVLANATASLQEQWCKAGVDLTMQWLGGVTHDAVGRNSGPAVVEWLNDRFEGRKTSPNCDAKPPVEPYKPNVELAPIPTESASPAASPGINGGSPASSASPTVTASSSAAK